jgi:hypothetical protein
MLCNRYTFYVDFLVYALCAGCCYAECLYAECHGTTGEDDGSSKKLECLSVTNFFSQVPFLPVMQVKLFRGSPTSVVYSPNRANIRQGHKSWRGQTH